MAAYGSKREVDKYAKANPEYGYPNAAALARGMANCAWFGKSFRPWFITPPREKLDAEKVWVGFEVETGYTTNRARQRAIDFLNQKAHRWCLDPEGSGSYPVEFTFYPVHLDQIASVQAGPKRLVQMAKMEGMVPAEHIPRQLIGTHLNISTPTSRRYNRTVPNDLFNAAIYALTDAERTELFGRREVYVGLRSQGSYYEFKMFNSTYDQDTLDCYMIVSKAVVDMVLLAEAGEYSRSAQLVEHFRQTLGDVRNLRAKQHRKNLAGFRRSIRQERRAQAAEAAWAMPQVA